jgi:Post-transcriptional regulator
MEKEKQKELREQLMPALQCKYDEFRLLGYKQVTIDQIWDCLVQKKWKNFKEERKLFELVNDILSLQIGEYMSFITMQSYKEQRSSGNDDLEAVLNELL